MENSDLEREMKEAVDFMESMASEYGYTTECPNHANKNLTYDGFAIAADAIREPFFTAVGSL